MGINFKISLQPKQKECLDAVASGKYGWIGAGGARGGAKSHGWRQIVLLRRLQFPGTAALIIRRKHKEVLENHVERYFSENPILRNFYNKADHVFTLPNMSRIVMGYAENPALEDFIGDIYDFQGHQYMDIFVDEAQQFNQRELTFLKTCNRWPGAVDTKGDFGRPCQVLAMNPGGRGHNFLKRIFIDKKYEENEHAEDYLYVPTFAWDNIEWVRQNLKGQNNYEKLYYAGWTDKERKEFFLKSASDYGKVLTSLKGKMREAYLNGNWDAFAGQYFDVWEEDEHVWSDEEIRKIMKPWHPRWVSMDWGYEHNTAVYWHAQCDNLTVTYRELVIQHSTPKNTGAMVAQMSQGEKIQDIYLSPDAFDLSRRKWISQDSVADQLNSELRANGITRAVRANDDRIGGAMLMYQLLSSNLWAISASCKRLISCIPDMQRDEENREDVLKVD